MTVLELLTAEDPRLEPADFLGAAVHQLQMADLVDVAALEHRDTVLDFFLDHPDAAERTCASGHLTGSALVVDATGTQTLLMLHRKLGRWFQPGGHADGNANLAAVALREATEETGIAGLRIALPAIDVDVHVVKPPSEVPHLHLDTRFLVVAPVGALEHANEESLALRWLSEAALDSLEPPVDESTRRLVRRGLALATQLLAG